MRLSAAQPMSVRLTSFYLPVRAGHGQKRMETEFFQIAVTYWELSFIQRSKALKVGERIFQYLNYFVSNTVKPVLSRHLVLEDTRAFLEDVYPLNTVFDCKWMEKVLRFQERQVAESVKLYNMSNNIATRLRSM